MKKRIILLVGLSLGVMAQGHAELSADDVELRGSNPSESAQDEGAPTPRGRMEEGSLDHIDPHGKQIVVSDQVRDLSDIVIIDGDQRLAHQVLDRLEAGTRVRIRQYKPSRSQPPVVTEIVTDAESSR